MKLLTKAIEKEFKKVGRQEKVKDPVIIAKFFNPTGASTWYATEYDPEDHCFFGYVDLYGDGGGEWGYFSLDELAEFRGQFGLGIERDLYFSSKPASEVIH
jgi:hypothetical protein